MTSRTRRVLAFLLWLICLLIPSTLSAQEPVDSTSPTEEWKTEQYGAEMPVPFYPPATTGDTGDGLAPESRAPDRGVTPFMIAVWQSVYNNGWDIWAAVESETNLNRITREATADVNPAVRPGTLQVAYTRISEGNSDIYRAMANGNSSTPLITSPAGDNYATYSGDGQWLYFASSRSGNWEIYRANADGGDITPITNDAAPDIMPGVSRDGTKITWVRQVSPTQGIIMGANADGTNPTFLSNPITYLQHPKFSPDGTRIGFDGDLNGNSWNDIGFLNLATGAITTNPNAVGYNNIDYWFSAWSPYDPNEIMYTRVVYIAYQGQLYLQEGRIYNEVIGQGPRQLFNDPLALNAAWERTEVIAPTVSVAPLPDYSKVLGFGVVLQGADAGAAPINRYEVQIRTTGAWVPYGGFVSTTIPIVQPSGTELEVRAMAMDAAGNRSAFSAPQRTQLYSGELTVKATDVLGNPQPDTTFDIVPPPLTADTIGDDTVFVRHTSPNTVTVRVDAPEFGSLPPAALNAQADRVFTTYIPGTDNRMVNGTFTDTLEGWETGGDVPPMAASGGHGDATGVWFCNYGDCWGQAANPDSSFRSSAAALDVHDTLHLVYSDCCDQRMNYRTYSRTAGWSERSEAFTAVNAYVISSMRMHASTDGTLHLTYGDNNQLRYIRRSPAGVWSAAEVLHSYQGTMTEIPHGSVLDQNGRLHLLFWKWVESSSGARFQYFYRQRHPDGTWSPEELIAKHGVGPDGSLSLAPSLLVTPGGTVHAWIGSIGHYERDAAVGWRSVYYSADPASPIYTGTSVRDWVLAPNGTIHAVFARTAGPGQMMQFRYGTFSPVTHQWTGWNDLSAITTQGGGGPTAVAIRPDGSVLILGNTGNEPLLYRRDVHGIWDEPIPWRDGLYFYGQDILDFTHEGDIRLVGRVGATYLTLPATEQTSLLHQQVDLTGLTRPTLGFMYRFEHAWRDTDATLTVSVTNGITATELFRSQATTAQQQWTLGSADLSLYSGEIVTVTFAYHQPANQPWVNLMVDDVTLSSYRAPVLMAASPAVIESNWAGEVITVTGQNFTAPLTVRLNGITVTASRLDDTTFTFVMPAGAEAGVQQVSVTNGPGLTNRKGLIRLGQGLFLPVVQR